MPGMSPGSTSATTGAASMPMPKPIEACMAAASTTATAMTTKPADGDLGAHPAATVEVVGLGRSGGSTPRRAPGRSASTAIGGSAVAHSSVAFQQRVRNRQPDGGFSGDGISPDRMMCSRRVVVVERRRGRHQGGGVRVQRPVERRLGGALLDDPAEVHHHHPVGHVPHDGQVVGDEQVGDAELLLQLVEQVQHLRLHREVERRDRLVADDHVGVQRERPGDAEPLALAAGELLRVLVGVRGSQPDQVQQLAHPGRAVAGGLVEGRVGAPRLGDDVAGRHPRVERRERVLEDHLHPAPELQQLLAA